MTDTNTQDDGWATIPKKPARRNKPKQNNDSRDSDPIQDVLPWISYIPPTPINTKYQPFMIMLCGIPGSGKSTFSKGLEQAMPYKFVRINQDDLGTRQRCEERTRVAFSEGKCPVIDRCNFDADQREKFIKIAYEFQAQVDCIVFEMETLVTVDECIQRCKERRGHPTIKPGEARGVVIGMAKQMDPPKLIGNKEGIRIVTYVTGKHKFNDSLVDCMNKV